MLPAGLVGQTCGVEMTVYVEDWQLDCCDEPFSVGSHVSWTLIRGRSDWIQTILGPGTDITVGAKEEHHGRIPASAPATQGTVNDIYAVWCQYAPPTGSPGPLEAVPGSGLLIPVTQAHRFGRHHHHSQGKFIGYIAQLRVG